MRLGRWLRWLKWPVTLAALGGLLAGAYFVNREMREERAAEAGGDVVQAPRRARNGVVTLTPDMVKDNGIQDEPARALDWSEPITVYGRLVPNPRTTAAVQAPFAGTLRADPKQPWPAVGTTVKAGQVLGQINVRVGPAERLDLKSKLTDARLKVRGAEKVAAVRQETFDRLEKASKGGGVVSQKELDDARVLLTEAKTNLASAQAAEKLWQGALEAIDKPGESGALTYALPLTAPAEGEVVEAAARPGMSLEAGAVIARIVDFRRPLAQVDLPPEVLAAGPPKTIELTTLPATPGQKTAPSPGLTAELLGPAPHVDPTSQFSSFWYEGAVKAEPGPAQPEAWRPGRFVTALVRLPNAAKRPAVAVPVGALLTHQGRHLVYVKKAPGEYERREVHLLGREGDRAVLAKGVRAGEEVVVRQPQVLLSEEFRSTAEEK
jgi:cobalt-zinc-cadmium efflux system membrane fusion protein